MLPEELHCDLPLLALVFPERALAALPVGSEYLTLAGPRGDCNALDRLTRLLVSLCQKGPRGLDRFRA